MQKDLKKEARQIFEAGLRAVDPSEAVKRFLTLEGNTLLLGEQELDLEDFEGIWAIGAGKASAAMAQAVGKCWRTGLAVGWSLSSMTTWRRLKKSAYWRQDIPLQMKMAGEPPKNW